MDHEKQASRLGQLPPEMLEFTLLRSSGALAPRLGRLLLPGRRPLLTPNFIGATSRGVVPHISQDNFEKCLDLGGVHLALEDFIEKFPQQTPPIFQYDVPQPLREFVALPKSIPIILGARRTAPIPTPVPNSDSEISLLTSVGYISMSADYYAAAALKLQPDIVVALADIPFGQETVGTRRKDKMSDRTESWLRDLIAKRNAGTNGDHDSKFSIFAPMLPVERDLQAWYLEHLVEDDIKKHVKGLAIYDPYILDHVPEGLHQLPKLSLYAPATPHELLRQVGLGMDIFTIPFIASATDAGIAFDFTFPVPERSSTGNAHDPSIRQELGIDMWDPEHAASLTPLSSTCTCYACTRHHRAYIQHLLSAKEMLGWTLLQIHNHAVLTTFFSSIRDCLSPSIEAFNTAVSAFTAYYAPDLPAKTGQGPRIRGYQFKNEDRVKMEKKNPKAYRKFTEQEKEKLRSVAAERVAQRGAKKEGKRMEERDMVDDEALAGLVGIEGDVPDADGAIASDGADVLGEGKGFR